MIFIELTWLFSLRHLPQFSFLHGLQNQGLKSNLNFHTGSPTIIQSL